MVRRYRPPMWHLTLSGLVIAAAIIAVLYLQWQSRPAEFPPVQAALPPPSKPEPNTAQKRHPVPGPKRARGPSPGPFVGPFVGPVVGPCWARAWARAPGGRPI